MSVSPLLEAARPPGRSPLQAEMGRVWKQLDNLDAESTLRILDAMTAMRRDVLDRLVALPTAQIDGVETFQATSLNIYANDLREIRDRFSARVGGELGSDMRSAAAFSDQAHRDALDALARANGVPPSLIRLAPLGLSDLQVEAAVLLNQSSIVGVSQAVVSAVNKELQAVVFGGQSRWDAVRNIRDALGTDPKNLGALTQRAITIERTGLIQVFNVAAEHAYRQAKEELPDLEVEWITAKDKRVDPICVSLSGARKKPGGTFPGGLMAPPAHPRCRCRILAWMPGWGKTAPPPAAPQRPNKPKAPPKPKAAPKPKAPAPGAFKDLREAEKEMKALYPHIQFDFEKAHIDTINPSMAAFHKLARAWPDVTTRLDYVGTLARQPYNEPYGRFSSDRTMAHATVNGRAIALNPQYYGNPATLRRATEGSVRAKFHPPGTEPMESVITHEFGHMVDNWARTRGSEQVTPGAWATGLGLRRDTLDMWLQAKAKPAGAMAAYAKESKAEQFAELFAASQLQAKPSTLVRQFKALLKDVVRAPRATPYNVPVWIRDLPDADRAAAIAHMKALGKRLGVDWP